MDHTWWQGPKDLTTVPSWWHLPWLPPDQHAHQLLPIHLNLNPCSLLPTCRISVLRILFPISFVILCSQLHSQSTMYLAHFTTNLHALVLKPHVALVQIVSQNIDLGQSPISVSPSSPSFPSLSLSVNQCREVPSRPISDTFRKASASSLGHNSNISSTWIGTCAIYYFQSHAPNLKRKIRLKLHSDTVTQKTDSWRVIFFFGGRLRLR